ncbi:PPE family protein, partial [Mycobacterium ulcerans]
MNFIMLPPEINSARIFAGAGVGPTLAAAAAWDALAADLASAAQSFAAITVGLVGEAWQGAAATAMAAAARPYASWLGTAAARAAVTAAQANAAAAVFEAAQAATAHPELVAANRNQLVSLVVSNLFGQNAPAIASTEAAYDQLWAQDVAAMAGYHSGASAVAAQLAPWQQALRTLQNRVAGATTALPPPGPAAAAALPG